MFRMKPRPQKKRTRKIQYKVVREVYDKDGKKVSTYTYIGEVNVPENINDIDSLLEYIFEANNLGKDNPITEPKIILTGWNEEIDDHIIRDYVIVKFKGKKYKALCLPSGWKIEEVIR